MRILLDTHALIWAVAATNRLDAETLDALANPANEILFSSVCIWEIAIRFALGRPDFALSPEEILAAALEIGFVELPVTAVIAARVARLPLIHRDPFDRLLVAQAMAEPATLYTADRRLTSYSELVRVIAPP
ncbi:MAG TPA: type II toxin-antitoxin system VapC family toxin [Stellaceae bacterium]|jgi:PIN domain nuclease of toxin-antitoxin system